MAAIAHMDAAHGSRSVISAVASWSLTAFTHFVMVHDIVLIFVIQFFDLLQIGMTLGFETLKTQVASGIGYARFVSGVFLLWVDAAFVLLVLVVEVAVLGAARANLWFAASRVVVFVVMPRVVMYCCSSSSSPNDSNRRTRNTSRCGGGRITASLLHLRAVFAATDVWLTRTSAMALRDASHQSGVVFVADGARTILASGARPFGELLGVRAEMLMLNTDAFTS